MRDHSDTECHFTFKQLCEVCKQGFGGCRRVNRGSKPVEITCLLPCCQLEEDGIKPSLPASDAHSAPTTSRGRVSDLQQVGRKPRVGSQLCRTRTLATSSFRMHIKPGTEVSPAKEPAVGVRTPPLGSLKNEPAWLRWWPSEGRAAVLGGVKVGGQWKPSQRWRSHSSVEQVQGVSRTQQGVRQRPTVARSGREPEPGEVTRTMCWRQNVCPRGLSFLFKIF